LQIAVPPTKRIEGVVRDQDSGSPISELEIVAAVFEERSFLRDENLKCTTDSDGRYRLDGLPKAAAYRLFLKPAKGLPYLPGTIKVPANSPAFEPVTFDFALKRGIVVRGKVTETSTGRPVQGSVSYYAFVDNPHLSDYHTFSQGSHQYAPIDEVGCYELVALPGRGILTVRDADYRFRPAKGYEGMKGYDARLQGFITIPGYVLARANAVVDEIDVVPGTRKTVRDLQADPGRSVDVSVVGPNGRPVTEMKVKGMSDSYATAPYPQFSDRFTVYGFDPSTPRRVVVMQTERKLIGSVVLTGNEAGRVVIKLEPWGSVTGRIVDDEGRPRKAMCVGSPNGSENKQVQTHDILPGADWNDGIRAGNDGRFYVEGLVPGVRYSAVARTGFERPGDLFKDIIVSPGEAKDLGDLKVRPPKND
jgi:hypothetical protein